MKTKTTKKRAATKRPSKAHKWSDPLPANWLKKYRRVYHGVVRAGDIVAYAYSSFSPEWCDGIVGTSVGSNDFIYRRK